MISAVFHVSPRLTLNVTIIDPLKLLILLDEEADPAPLAFGLCGSVQYVPLRFVPPPSLPLSSAVVHRCSAELRPAAFGRLFFKVQLLVVERILKLKELSEISADFRVFSLFACVVIVTFSSQVLLQPIDLVSNTNVSLQYSVREDKVIIVLNRHSPVTLFDILFLSNA